MEDILADMWSGLFLSENEASTLFIDSAKLSIPSNALVGKLAMRKNVCAVEIEKSLRVIWDVVNSMEVTLLDDNLFMFTFRESRACERVLERQPWNY